MILKTPVFGLYSDLWIYTGTDLQTVYQDWLQAVLDSNSRWAWKWRSSELRVTHRHRDWATLEMHMEVVIGWMWWYTWRPWSSELWDPLRDWDLQSLEMHLERCWWQLGGRNLARLDIHMEAMIVQVGRYSLGGHDRANVKAEMEPVRRCSCRPSWCNLAGCNRASVEILLEGVIKRVWRSI